MARNRSFVRGAAAIRTKRQTLWIAGDWTTTAVSGAGAVLVASLNAAALALRPFTILRHRGYFRVISDQQAASESFGLSVAHAVVSDQATAIGVTAVPTPVTDLGSDLFYQFESAHASFVFSSAVGIDGNEGTEVRWDSKAMRKVSNDEDLIHVVEGNGLGSGMTYFSMSRILIRRN